MVNDWFRSLSLGRVPQLWCPQQRPDTYLLCSRCLPTMRYKGYIRPPLKPENFPSQPSSYPRINCHIGKLLRVFARYSAQGSFQVLSLHIWRQPWFEAWSIFSTCSDQFIQNFWRLAQQHFLMLVEMWRADVKRSLSDLRWKERANANCKTFHGGWSLRECRWWWRWE